MKPLHITLILLLLPALASAAGLHGTYTIGGKSPDFNSFHEAAKALKDSGVSAAVIFNVRDGRYNDSVKISFVKGSSLINTITFQSESGDSSKVILYSKAINAVFILDNAPYITIQKMTINNTGVKYGLNNSAGIYCTRFCIYDNFLNNEFDSGTFIIEAGEYCGRITNNYFKNNDLEELAEDTSRTQNIEISGNIFKPGSIFAVDNRLLIHNNSISVDSLRNVGMHLFAISNSRIYNNEISILSANPSGCFGLIIQESGDSKHSNYVYDNFIASKVGGDGINLSYDSNLYFYNNSFSMRGPYGDAIGQFQSEIILYNNIFAADSGEIVGDYYTGKGKSDYNLFYNFKSSYTGLADRQKYGKDKHSIVANPGFLSAFDLHTFSTNVKGKGTSLALVTTDIDGDIRNAKHPDIGADEFGFIPDDDIGIAVLYPPPAGPCGKDSDRLGFKVKNYGVKPEGGFKVSMQTGGAASDTFSYTFTDTLRRGRDTIIYPALTPAFNTSKGGKFNYTAYTELYSDSNHINDTAGLIFNVRPLPDAGFTFSVLNNKIDFSAINKTLKTYTWNFGDTSLADSTVNPSHTYPKKSGSYIVSLAVSDSFGCRNSSRDTLSIIYTGVENMNNSTLAVNISPNPVKNILELRGPLERGMIYIMDMEGRAYQSKEVMKGMGPINTDVSSLPKGMYLLKYISERGIWVCKFIKE